ncbi:hypothetical protein D7X98_07295 [bacterium 1XD8-76]|nr:hypothetical protein D7X98_07295 [bacterium 1XD8-76]
MLFSYPDLNSWLFPRFLMSDYRIYTIPDNSRMRNRHKIRFDKKQYKEKNLSKDIGAGKRYLVK